MMTELATSTVKFAITKEIEWTVSNLSNYRDGQTATSSFEFAEGLLGARSSLRPTLHMQTEPDGDGVRISLIWAHPTTAKVTWSLIVSSGDVAGAETEVFGDTRAKCSDDMKVKLKLSGLGQVGEMIRRTDTICVQIKLAVRACRADGTKCIVSDPPGPSFKETIMDGLVSEDLIELADVYLTDKEGQDHPAHKLILSMRSPVLRATFRHKMQESTRGCVSVQASSSAVKQLLKYIYSDQICDMIKNEENEEDDLLMELFDLACYYQLPGLQSLVEDRLMETLSVANVAYRLPQAVLHNSSITDACLKLVKHNVAAVMKTAGWGGIPCNALVMEALVHGVDKKGVPNV